MMNQNSRQGITVPSCDLVDFQANNTSYCVQVLLPGVNQDGNLRIVTKKDEAYVEGLVQNIEALKEAVEKDELKLTAESTTGNICVLLKLPIQVNPRYTRASFNPDHGLLEVIFANAEQPKVVRETPNDYFQYLGA